jgi:pimeloyl-ACP methyl ester carboxylesterase
VLLLLGDGTRLPVTELPGDGPWTFLVLEPGTADPGPATPATGSPSPEPGGAARLLTRHGRAVVPDLRGRAGFGVPPGEAGSLGLVDDLDQIRTRAGLGRPVLVGLGALAPVALQAGVEQPWAWRALVLAPPAGRPAGAAELGRLDLPVLVLDAEPAAPPEAEELAGAEGRGSAGVERVRLGDAPWQEQGPVAAALERLLGRLGGGPGWAGIAPDAPPR